MSSSIIKFELPGKSQQNYTVSDLPPDMICYVCYYLEVFKILDLREVSKNMLSKVDYFCNTKFSKSVPTGVPMAGNFITNIIRLRLMVHIIINRVEDTGEKPGYDFMSNFLPVVKLCESEELKEIYRRREIKPAMDPLKNYFIDFIDFALKCNCRWLKMKTLDVACFYYDSLIKSNVDKVLEIFKERPLGTPEDDKLEKIVLSRLCESSGGNFSEDNVRTILEVINRWKNKFCRVITLRELCKYARLSLDCFKDVLENIEKCEDGYNKGSIFEGLVEHDECVLHCFKRVLKIVESLGNEHERARALKSLIKVLKISIDESVEEAGNLILDFIFNNLGTKFVSLKSEALGEFLDWYIPQEGNYYVIELILRKIPETFEDYGCKSLVLEKLLSSKIKFKREHLSSVLNIISNLGEEYKQEEILKLLCEKKHDQLSNENLVVDILNYVENFNVQEAYKKGVLEVVCKRFNFKVVDYICVLNSIESLQDYYNKLSILNILIKNDTIEGSDKTKKIEDMIEQCNLLEREFFKGMKID